MYRSKKCSAIIKNKINKSHNTMMTPGKSSRKKNVILNQESLRVDQKHNKTFVDVPGWFSLISMSGRSDNEWVVASSFQTFLSVNPMSS